MNNISRWMSAGCLSLALLAANGVAATRPPSPPIPQDQPKPTYSAAEYNAFQAAHNEQNAQAKLKALDDFSSKYPTPDQLTPYVYRDYYLTYYSLKNYPQTLVFVDKLLALGDKVDFRIPPRSSRRSGAGILHRVGRQGAADSRAVHQGAGRRNPGHANADHAGRSRTT